MEWRDNDRGGGRGNLFDETLGKSMRWWATETSDGRLLLRRSVMIRCCALVALVVGVPAMIYNVLPLMSPYITEYEVKDAMIGAIMFGIPVVWAINTLRRRTVLSKNGITMRRLLFTERRPWESVGSRFTLSTLNLTEDAAHSGFIERTRIAIENGDDDAIRLPGCVIGMTWGSSEDRASAAVGDLQYYIYARGWGISEEVAVSEDPHLVAARVRHGAEKMLQRSRLVFRTPLWRRIKEHLCNGGLFLIGVGVLFLVIGGQQLFFETEPLSGSDIAFALLFLLLGPVTMAYPLYKIYECFQRVVVDEQGIRVGRRSCVWPESRSGLFVAGDRIFVVYGNGRHLALDGAGVTWGSFQRRQEQLVARCEAIWLWGVAHGATRETGRYVPLGNAGMQEEREILERGIGLAVPRRGQPA
ncbi:hypothetical protein HMPREF2883_00640 [Actinomyces sp. HMSC075C01]|uniref:hypothetical protein n=1 Tax=Actinomyces sp. HMSC075C01 TaxID=1739387 RepID=UPI0008A615C6|nr:hypothetical protein [Actinomyces sp. HMSC075C01]OFR58294.1 hypothetical protein HMPREF2883_00640 [Actinomyces sp. HMSC075C01]